MLDAVIRPHLLITDAFNADYVQARRMQRDEQLMSQCLESNMLLLIFYRMVACVGNLVMSV
jgi:hypothetical protein